MENISKTWVMGAEGHWDMRQTQGHRSQGTQGRVCHRDGGHRQGYKGIDMQHLRYGTWETEGMGQTKDRGHRGHWDSHMGTQGHGDTRDTRLRTQCMERHKILDMGAQRHREY